MSSLGPLISGIAKDYLGDFDLSLAAFALAPLPVAVLSVFATPPQRETEASPLAPFELATSEAT